MQRSVKTWTQHLLAAALCLWPAVSRPAQLEADPSASTFVIRASKRGLLSTLAHDHEFMPERWRAEADFDPRRLQELHVDVRVDAASLHDHVARLTAPVRAYVDREATGPEVLDVARYPEIGFHADAATVRRDGADFDGVLHGTLTLHGATRPLDVPFHARADGPGERVSGRVRFRQTDFGMTPFSRARGSIGVDDEIQVEFELVLVPASRGDAASAELGAR